MARLGPALCIGAAVLLGGVAGGVLERHAMTTEHHADAPSPSAIDIGFSQDMAVHHDQAVLMSRLVMDRASPPIRALASQIEATQIQEIGVLRGWLLLWNQPALASSPMRWMSSRLCGAYAVRDGSPMPGLATETELAELQAAKGAELDRMFLRMMTRHHLGGLSMLRAAVRGAALPAIRSVARNMQFEEAQEIGYMNGLAQHPGQGEAQVLR